MAGFFQAIRPALVVLAVVALFSAVLWFAGVPNVGLWVGIIGLLLFGAVATRLLASNNANVVWPALGTVLMVALAVFVLVRFDLPETTRSLGEKSQAADQALSQDLGARYAGLNEEILAGKERDKEAALENFRLELLALEARKEAGEVVGDDYHKEKRLLVERGQREIDLIEEANKLPEEPAGADWSKRFDQAQAWVSDRALSLVILLVVVVLLVWAFRSGRLGNASWRQLAVGIVVVAVVLLALPWITSQVKRAWAGTAPASADRSAGAEPSGRTTERSSRPEGRTQPGSAAPAGWEKVGGFRLDPTVAWQATGYTPKDAETLRFQVTGKVRLRPDWPEYGLGGARNTGEILNPEEYPAPPPSALQGELLIREGGVISPAAPGKEVPVNGGSQLEAMVNDRMAKLADNEGSPMVVILRKVK